MFNIEVSDVIIRLQNEIMLKVDVLFPKFLWAFIILFIGLIVSILLYQLTKYTLRKTKFIVLIDKLTWVQQEKTDTTQNESKEQTETQIVKQKIEKLNWDIIIAKSVSYYVFLIFFRFSIIHIGIKDVEIFLADLLAYLPSLFVWILIGFFGMRFANFIHDIVYQTFNLAKQQTGKIIAMWAKIIILFFTFMLVLNYTKVVDEFIINTILVGFISMTTIAWGLAFWLGGKDIAREILESFRK